MVLEPKKAHVLAILISIIETCRKRQQSPWIFLATVIHHRRSGLAVPKLPMLRGLNNYPWGDENQQLFVLIASTLVLEEITQNRNIGEPRDPIFTLI